MSYFMQRPVAVVTGCTSGIGLAITRELAKIHRVYTIGRSAPALDALAHALRNEESENGVRVSTVSPGPSDTPMNRISREQAGDFSAIDPRACSTPGSVAVAVRLVVDTSEDTQVTDVVVRPRRDNARVNPGEEHAIHFFHAEATYPLQ